MLETRIKFTGALEEDLKEYVKYQYADERGALNFTIKQAVIRFLKAESEEIKRKKSEEMLREVPAMIGKAIAQGTMEGQKRRESKSHIEAGWGESGEIICPKCGQPVTIGKITKIVVCTNCGAEYSVERVKKE